MNHKGIITRAVTCILFMTGLLFAQGTKPNFVFFLVDDLGVMDIGVYGSSFYDTPNVDKIAAEGMQFTEGYAPSPICSPTRAAIMLGKNPGRTDMTQWIGGGGNPTYVRNIPDSETTIAEALKADGYTTGFFGKWHLNDRNSDVLANWPQSHGFDVNIGGHWRGGLYIPNQYESPWDIPNMDNGPSGEYMTDRLGQETADFIEANKDAPFLAYLSFYTVHAPFDAPQGRITPYNDKRDSLNYSNAERMVAYKNNRDVRMLQDHPTYAAMVNSMDMAVGVVLDKVEALGLSDNTVVFFTSDNGGLSTSEGHPTSNIPFQAGKGWLYEGGIREPYIVKWPGTVTGGVKSDVPVTSMDFYPTILEMAGLSSMPNQHTDGKSLVPILKEEKTILHSTLYFHYPHGSNQGGRPTGAIRVGDYKLLNFFDDNNLELYNLKDDIGEENNLANSMPGLRDSLLGIMQKWWTDVDAKFPNNYTQIPNITPIDEPPVGVIPQFYSFSKPIIKTVRINGKLNVVLSLNKANPVKIRIVNIKGEELIAYNKGFLNSGNHTFTLDLPQQEGSGVLFAEFQFASGKQFQKLAFNN